MYLTSAPSGQTFGPAGKASEFVFPTCMQQRLTSFGVVKTDAVSAQQLDEITAIVNQGPQKFTRKDYNSQSELFDFVKSSDYHGNELCFAIQVLKLQDTSIEFQFLFGASNIPDTNSDSY